MDPTPMFPLGTTLVPGAAIPLQVFEPRYRQMVIDILAGDGPPEFGQVLITHGHEAGGGDERSDVGTLARMAEIQAIADGRYAFIAVGIERIRVVEWLADDPYPRAVTERWPDDTAPAIGHDDLVAASGRVSEVLELAARLAGDEMPAIDLADLADLDPTLATYRLAAMAPLGAADRYRLLSAPGPGARLHALDTALGDVEAMMKFRLS